jgi:hypothetical protein
MNKSRNSMKKTGEKPTPPLLKYKPSEKQDLHSFSIRSIGLNAFYSSTIILDPIGLKISFGCLEVTSTILRLVTFQNHRKLTLQTIKTL